MADAALASAGARVVAATCYDERHPPESVIDGDDSTFWVTTGLYPQEIVVALPKLTDVTRLTTVSMNVRKLVIEKCETDRPYTFEKALEAELTNMGSRGLQTETHQVRMCTDNPVFTVSPIHIGLVSSCNRQAAYLPVTVFVIYPPG